MEDVNVVEIGRGSISRIVMGRLRIGADLLESVEQIAKEGNIKTGVILSGIGALERALIRNARDMPPDRKMEDRHRLFVDIDRPSELVSLSGWIATSAEGELNVHAHFVVSTVMNEKIVSLGGHLVKGTKVSIKGVVIIGVIEDTNIKAMRDPVIDQVDISFG